MESVLDVDDEDNILDDDEEDSGEDEDDTIVLHVDSCFVSNFSTLSIFLFPSTCCCGSLPFVLQHKCIAEVVDHSSSSKSDGRGCSLVHFSFIQIQKPFSLNLCLWKRL